MRRISAYVWSSPSSAFLAVFCTGAKTVALGFAAVVLLGAGSFIYFACAVYGSDRLPRRPADPIVALGGDPERMRAAVNVLVNGYGRLARSRKLCKLLLH